MVILDLAAPVGAAQPRLYSFYAFGAKSKNVITPTRADLTDGVGQVGCSLKKLAALKPYAAVLPAATRIQTCLRGA
jgi:hypothetical protein